MFAGQLAAELMITELFNNLSQLAMKLRQLYDRREFCQAVREIMALADRANQILISNKPWVDCNTKNQLHKLTYKSAPWALIYFGY